jgi:hypothetical protein
LWDVLAVLGMLLLGFLGISLLTVLLHAIHLRLTKSRMEKLSGRRPGKGPWLEVEGQKERVTGRCVFWLELREGGAELVLQSLDGRQEVRGVIRGEGQSLEWLERDAVGVEWGE